MLSKRAAIVEAQRNLLELIEGVRITSGTTVKDMTLQSDVIGTRVKGMIRGAFITSENVYEDSGDWVAEVELSVCINSAPLNCRHKPNLASLLQSALDKTLPEKMYRPESNSASSNSSTEPRSTGLIVDLSAQEFAPQLDIRIQTPTGKELYGPAHVAPGTDWLFWSDSLGNASAMTDVIGERPLLVKSATIGNDSRIIVSEDDASDIFTKNRNGGDFLKQGKVVFVIK